VERKSAEFQVSIYCPFRNNRNLGRDILAKQGPNLVDPRLVKALGHPIRIEILDILKVEPSSAARIQRKLENVSLNLVSHHIKVLKELDCIELVETVTRRGAKERIYRAVEPFILSPEGWDALTPKMQVSLTMSILEKVSKDLARSLGAGKFDEISDSHLSGSPLKLDREGWSEIVDLLAGTLGRVLEIGDTSAERAEASDEAQIPVTVVIMQFPTA
jgi:DNA-binding transcriptional ArsR family regulator